MDITVSTARAALLIDSITQTAMLLPAVVQWKDGDVTGKMVIDSNAGRLVAHDLHVQGPARTFDSVEYVRNKLKVIIRDAKDKITIPVIIESDGRMTVAAPMPGSAPAEARPRRQWRKLSDEFLEAVSRTFLEARDSGSPPIVAVMNEWDAPRATANDWIRLARDKGFLPPAIRSSPR